MIGSDVSKCFSCRPTTVRALKLHPSTCGHPRPFPSTTRYSSPKNGQPEAALSTDGSVTSCVSLREACVSHAQQLNSDTLQVPDLHGVQCCLVHGRPCRPSGFLGVTATFLPFPSPCYDIFSLIPFHWQRCCCRVVSLFVRFVLSFGLWALDSFYQLPSSHTDINR